MRIINLEQFLKEPLGTMYCQYTPDIIDGPFNIKWEWLSSDNASSWWELPLAAWWEDGIFTPDIGVEAQTKHAMNRQSSYMYESDSLFAVLSISEIKAMIDVLGGAIKLLGERR